MDLLTCRAFSTELSKIATELLDADVRALLADRQGKEYLPGGRLPTNAIGEDIGPQGDFSPTAESQFEKKGGFGEIQNQNNPLELVKARQKSTDSRYQNARDAALTAAGGATFGAALMRVGHAGITNFNHGAGRLPWKDPTGRMWAVSGALGAGTALADRLYRHRKGITTEADAGKTKAMPIIKKAGLNSSTFTPGRALATGRKVSHTLNMPHLGEAKPAAGLMGREGRIPTARTP